MNESQTEFEYIDPALREAGWGVVEGSRVRKQHPITQGRLLGQGRKSQPLKADYLLEYKNRKLARQKNLDLNIFAKKNQGKFLVRIEDTDKERSEEQFIEAIMEGLDWVGLNPDFEPIKQSERFDIYKEEATRLMDLGEAYEDEGAVRLKVKREGSTLVKDLVYGDIEFLNSELDQLDQSF